MFLPGVSPSLFLSLLPLTLYIPDPRSAGVYGDPQGPGGSLHGSVQFATVQYCSYYYEVNEVTAYFLPSFSLPLVSLVVEGRST